MSGKELKILTNRFDKIDPASIDDYINTGGYKALKKALEMPREEIIKQVKASNLRGRGGAAFPTGIKLESVYKEREAQKYLVCNADEGEPGNFKDRFLIENDPHQVIEGMIICAFAVGSSKGYIYVRGEYDKPISLLKTAIEQAKAKNFLGGGILGTSFNFELEVRTGAGAYVCGEEFALIESIEGKSGKPRFKPPFPTMVGVFNKPTLLNNVETYSNIPYIINEGGEKFAAIGTPSSSGTRLISLSGNVNNKGLFEVPFGVSIREIIDLLGKGIPNGRKIKMVQLAGASGPIIPENMLDLRIDYKEMADNNLSLGSGAIIVIDDRFDVLDIVYRIAKFFEHESCGKCTPCRNGNKQLVKIIKKFVTKTATEKDLSRLDILINVMTQASLCGLGQAAPTAIATTMKYFNEDYLGGICENEKAVAIGG
ncbi:MAG: NADP-reducing hydrogenase subunit HndC [Firmicutes bacterium ADurb.Bin300]|nr:MAG: NADP-reducing hydrogenase subunit HndC [Firmicutes bacterium ADurb.Bin300]